MKTNDTKPTPTMSEDCVIESLRSRIKRLEEECHIKGELIEESKRVIADQKRELASIKRIMDRCGLVV